LKPKHDSLKPNWPKQTWQNIQAEIIRRISERVWPPGSLIPKEIDLVKEFKCSRGTVNRAMRELANAGLIDRKRKAGTRVALNPVRKATLDIPVIRLDVENRGVAHKHVVLSRKILVAPILITSKLGLAVGTPLLHLRTLHFAGNQPFLFEKRWVNQSAVPDILDVDFSEISANEWLVQNAPLTTGDISFSAAGASKDEAEILGAKTGEALFVIDRSTWIGTMPVTNARLAYAPGFQMNTKL